MNWTRFLCKEEVDGDLYIINTLTRAVAQVTQDTLDRLEGNNFIPHSSEDEAIISDLIDDWFLGR
jgi:hypothetical protein